MITPKHLGLEIARAREAMNLTQNDVARLSENRVSQANLSAIESGRTIRPKIETLEAIAEVLDLNVTRLKFLAGILTKEEAASQGLPEQDPFSDEKLDAHILRLLSRLQVSEKEWILESMAMLPYLSQDSQEAVLNIMRSMSPKDTQTDS